MADGFDGVYVDTRRQLRGVAESLIAGPQYRASGTIRLAVRPDGFTGVSIPIAVHGTELVLPDGSVALDGPVSEIAAGLDSGPPDGVYDVVDPLPADAVLSLDAAAAEWIHRSHYAGGHAIKNVLPEQHPVLWPEHFDVAADRGRGELRGLRRRRLPPDALRVRRAVDPAQRTVLERAVRSACTR